jgi:hypothetical protein
LIMKPTSDQALLASGQHHIAQRGSLSCVDHTKAGYRGCVREGAGQGVLLVCVHHR